MADQDTSIGTDSDLPVDGIAGTNPGTQQPRGADVHAGGEPAGKEPEIVQPAAGRDHEGKPQPKGVTGMMGRARAFQSGELNQIVQTGKVNGSLSLSGRTIGVRLGCGAIGRPAPTIH